MNIAVLQWFLLAFFVTPLVEMVLMVVGVLWSLLFYREDPNKHRELIIQVTTVGKEVRLVQKTVSKIRSYNLRMPYRIWVVVEPEFAGLYGDFVGAEVMVVPKGFKCLPIDKARALEWSRLERVKRGLNRADVKIMFVDDDTLPSKRYIRLAFNGDYDVCQGITIANRWFGALSFRHFLLSHMDNIRVRNCLIYCSCTQGVTQKPCFVHGEGLCITGWAEDVITWDRRIIASDDLVFGTNAAHQGLSWGFFLAAIQLVSPHSFKDAFNQKKRWTFGNLDAIKNRKIMPLAAAIFKAWKYLFGLVSVPASLTGAILLLNGVAKVPPQAHVVFWISLGAWFFSYGLSGWLAAGGEPNQERLGHGLKFWANRIWQTVAATILTPFTALAPIVIIVLSLVNGRPKDKNGDESFLMIAKADPKMFEQLEQADSA